MTGLERIITVLIAGFATVLTRFLPFVIFKGKKTPKALDYLGFALPCSVFGMLLVYCLKDTVVTSFPFALPEFLGLAVTSAIYLWKKNTLISIAAGTVFYMFLVQVVF
ncbi:MAG: AzlD domain-containing protein [Spirochaetales bacterium]|nr:AzlD domain-containing protein [Spirochaetales bacterium]